MKHLVIVLLVMIAPHFLMATVGEYSSEHSEYVQGKAADITSLSAASSIKTNVHEIASANTSVVPSPGNVVHCSSEDPSFYEPKPDIKPLKKGLAKDVLRDCPQEIIAIVNMLNNRFIIGSAAFPRKLLLVGPPGTGKTTLGKAIAEVCDLPVAVFNAASIANEYKNSGTQNLERIFRRAAQDKHPCIIVMDELEVLFKQHDNKYDSESGMLMRLWTLLDEYADAPLLFIGTFNDATGAPEQIKNRFRGYIVDIPLPDEEQRRKILTYCMQSYDGICFDKNISVRILARKTKGFAHRDLGNLIQIAVMNAHMKNSRVIAVTMKDCIQAIYAARKADGLFAISWRKSFPEFLHKWGSMILNGVGLTLTSYGLYQGYQNGIFQEETHIENRNFQERSWQETLRQNALAAKWNAEQKESSHRMHADSQRSQTYSLYMQGASTVLSAVSLVAPPALGVVQTSMSFLGGIWKSLRSVTK